MDMMIRFPNLGVELGYVGRSIRIFGFEITFGGMLLALGMLAGLAFIVLEAKRRNENQDAYVGMMITAVICQKNKTPGESLSLQDVFV